MHREHAIENLGRNEMVVRNDELNPHDGRFDAANDKKYEGVENIENPQLLVIHSDNPIVKDRANGLRHFASGGERD